LESKKQLVFHQELEIGLVRFTFLTEYFIIFEQNNRSFMDTKTLIEEVRNSLKESGVDLKGIYLFGSRSKDKQHRDSDYDLAIILKSAVSQSIKDSIRSVIYDIMLKYDVVIDSHIYSEKDILNPQTPFREIIKSEGIFYAG
jgi:predicted nucleotidyltransferase